MKRIPAFLISVVLLFCAQESRAALGSEALYKQGMEAFESGNYSSAELLFRKALDSDEDEITDRAWFYLARSYFHQKNYGSAVHEFTSYLNKCRTASLCQESRYWMGESYFYLKQYPKAIEEFKRYISKNDGDRLTPFAHDRIASIYYIQTRYDEAIIEWRNAIRKSGDKNANLSRTFNIGEALFQGRQYDEALSELTPLISAKTEDRTAAGAQMIIGRIHQIRGNHGRALIAFNSIPDSLIRVSPYNEAQYLKALSLIARGDLNGAKSLLEIYILIAMDSKWYYHALNELGRINIRSGETEKGIKQLDEVRNSGNNPELKQNVDKYLGAYYIDSNPEKAIPYLEEYSKDLSDSDKDLMLALGKAYLAVKRLDDADEILTRYETRFPFDRNLDQAKFLRARIYLERNQSDRAMELLESIRKENPFSTYIGESNFYLALVNYRKGDYGKAVGYLNSYLYRQSIENRYEAVTLLARSHLELNDLNRARGAVNIIVNQFVSKADSHEIIYQFSMALYSRGMNSRWYMDFIIQKFPSSESAARLYMLLANDALKARKYDEASQFYSRYLASGKTENRGTAFSNRLTALYNLKRYNDVIASLKNDVIPPMDENQWKEIPVLLTRCYHETDQPEKIYSLLMSENMEGMPSDVVSMFITSAVGAGDIELARSRLQLISGDRERYAEALFAIASYYASHSKNDEALEYYSRIFSEYGSTARADFARYEYARMIYDAGRYSDALDTLKTISNRELNNEKNALMILCLFLTGDEKNATAMTNRELFRILKNPRGEEIVKANMRFYFDKKNTAQFNRFAGYLAGYYKGSSDYVSFMYGKYFYSLQDFRTSFYYFSKVSGTENPYSAESWFNMGNISLFADRNRQQAIAFYQKVIEKDRDSDFGYRARIELSIIYHEINRKDESLKLLDEIIGGPSNKIYHIQAQNLHDSFIKPDSEATSPN